MLKATGRGGKRVLGLRASSPITLLSDTSSECSMSSKKVKFSIEKPEKERMVTRSRAVGGGLPATEVLVSANSSGMSPSFSAPVQKLDELTIGKSEHSPVGKFLVDVNGAPVAITITEDKGKLETSLVPIAQKVAKAENCNHPCLKSGKDVEDISKKNQVKWEQLEYEMHLCKDLVERCVEEESYGIGFEKLDDVYKTVKLEVCSGRMSAQGGMSKFFDYMRGLLDVYVTVIRGKKEYGRLKIDLLGEALETMTTVEYETYNSGYYGVGYKNVEMEESTEESNSRSSTISDSDYSVSDESEMSLIVQAAIACGGRACSNTEDPKIGQVHGPEDFGDAELSESDTDSEWDADNASDSDTVSSEENEVTDCKVYKAARVRRELNAFAKLLKRYNLGLSMLPELLKQRTFATVTEKRQAIENRGYTAKQAFADLQEKVGKLRPNAEIRKMFLQGTLVEDLDG